VSDWKISEAAINRNVLSKVMTGTYRRLISKSAFMQFWAILTFLHIWKNESQGYLKKHGPW